MPELVFNLDFSENCEWVTFAAFIIYEAHPFGKVKHIHYLSIRANSFILEKIDCAMCTVDHAYCSYIMCPRLTFTSMSDQGVCKRLEYRLKCHLSYVRMFIVVHNWTVMNKA